MAEILTTEVVKPENTESEDHVTKEILQKREARPPKRLTKGTFWGKILYFFSEKIDSRELFGFKMSTFVIRYYNFLFLSVDFFEFLAKIYLLSSRNFTRFFAISSFIEFVS